MPTNVTDSNAWVTTLQVPNDVTEVANQASLLLFVQGLANRTTYNREGIPGKAVSYQLTIPTRFSYNINTRFSYISDGGIIQSDITDAGEILLNIPVPPVGKIDQVHVLCDGRDGTFGSAHGALPATKPVINLKKKTATPGNTNVSASSLGNTTDGSASASAYDTVHLISITGLAHTILADTDYILSIKGEAGASAIANNFAVYRAYAIITP